MSNVVSFWSSMFSVFSDFLLSEPIVYFVSLLLLFFVVSLLSRLLNISNWR